MDKLKHNIWYHQKKLKSGHQGFLRKCAFCTQQWPKNHFRVAKSSGLKLRLVQCMTVRVYGQLVKIVHCALFFPICHVCLCCLNNDDSQVYTGKFHPSGDILASSGFDRQIFLWKVYGEHQFNNIYFRNLNKYNIIRRMRECVSDERSHWGGRSAQVLPGWGYNLHCKHRQDGIDI